MNQENGVRFIAPQQSTPTKDMDVFYNPVMKTNRDISVAIISMFKPKRIADPLAGCGIRGIRMKLALPPAEVWINDRNPKAFALAQKNAKLNHADVHVTCADASEFLKRGFDYVDIDPFGSPNPFLDSAVRAVRSKGILALTATDTAPLSGTYPRACQRKYWATPCKNWMMHETGIRILIRKAQLIGAQYDKALIPIYCHATEHYFRTYLQCFRGKSKVDAVLALHEHIDFSKGIRTSSQGIGPLWTGKLFDPRVAQHVAKQCPMLMTETIAQEACIEAIGFYSTHQIAKGRKQALPPMEHILTTLRKKNQASRTHFSYEGIRTTATRVQVQAAMRKPIPRRASPK